MFIFLKHRFIFSIILEMGHDDSHHQNKTQNYVNGENDGKSPNFYVKMQ